MENFCTADLFALERVFGILETPDLRISVLGDLRCSGVLSGLEASGFKGTPAAF